MTADQLATLLTGTVGGLFLSLLLNYAFYKGWILNPKKTVPKEDYDEQKSLVVSFADSFATLAEKSKRKKG